MTAQSPSIRTLFEQALELQSPTERRSFLDEQCVHDAPLRAEVEGLLSAYSSAGEFLESPAADLQGIWSDVPETFASSETQSPGRSAAFSRFDFLDPPRRPDHLGRLAHYEISEVIGCGGMGIVMKAYDEKLQRLVAIKALEPTWAASEPSRKRFVREAQSAAAVCHDHLVPIYAVEDGSAVPYFVMQYIAGGSLQERIDREGPLPIEEVVRLGMQIAEGLSAAHRQGLVHRDIKPANILLEEESAGQGSARVRIADFGLARAVDDTSLSRAGIIAGTPEYMSPEQARGQTVDHRADLFSLSGVLYAMCSGRSPFGNDNSLTVLRRICDETPQNVRELRPEVPEKLAELIARLHAKRPADRPGSADEVRMLLERCASSLISSPLISSSSARGINRRTWLLVAGAAAAAAAVAFCIPRFRRRGPAQNQSGQSGLAQTPNPEPAPEISPAKIDANRRRWQPRVLLIIAARDFYYPEYGPVRNNLDLSGVECRVASTTLEECWPNDQSPMIPVTPDLRLADAKAQDYDAIYFVGGEGCLDYAEGGQHFESAKRLIREALTTKCIVSAVGMGVVVLAEADVMVGKRAAAYPFGNPPGIFVRRLSASGVKTTDDAVVEDGPFVTGRAPQDMRLFTITLLKHLGIEPPAQQTTAPPE